MPIIVKNLSFTYSPKTPYEKVALDNVDLTINDGDFVGVVGHTGSGKSTFLQHINGLIKLQDGSIDVFDIHLQPKYRRKEKPDLKRLRSEVGMVFQYPEYQLFEETVEKDIAFGAKNLGMPKEDIDNAVREAMELVGLDYETYRKRSPFDLSGGEKRRVAIAGVIVMKPKVLILDEPTAGLDPQGKDTILSLITRLKESCSPTIIVVSHDIDEITRFASRIVVFNDAKIKYDVPMTELFRDSDKLEAIGLDIPLAVKVRNALAAKGITLSGDIYNIDSLVNAVMRRYNGEDKTEDSSNAIGADYVTDGGDPRYIGEDVNGGDVQ